MRMKITLSSRSRGLNGVEVALKVPSRKHFVRGLSHGRGSGHREGGGTGPLCLVGKEIRAWVKEPE